MQPPDVAAVDLVRDLARSSFRRLLAGGEEPVEVDPHELGAAGDPGLFGPDSVTWRVHADLATLVGGLRALLLQSLHPLAMAGVAEHSDYRHDPWGRLERTAEFLAATTYGGTPQAEAAIATVDRVHRHVRGVAPDGQPYDARDPHLLLWVHVTLVDSLLRAHQRYGAAPLCPDEADRYVDEQAEVAIRLGSEPPPRSVAELRVWLQSVRPELAVGAQARSATRFLLAPPLPFYARPAYGVVSAAAIGLLPGFARRQLWLPLVPGVDPLAVRPSARLLLGTLRWFAGPSPHRLAAQQRMTVGKPRVASTSASGSASSSASSSADG